MIKIVYEIERGELFARALGLAELRIAPCLGALTAVGKNSMSIPSERGRPIDP